MTDNWISVDERMPDGINEFWCWVVARPEDECMTDTSGKPISAVFSIKPHFDRVKTYHTKQGELRFNCGALEKVTHWMPLPTPPNFPRSSQNQTVSSGVEGAHEGTTADKRHVCGMAGFNMLLGDTCQPCEARLAEPREPEKLNNAQKSVAAAAEPHHRKCGLLHGDTACNCSLWHALCNIQDYIVCEEETPERKLYVVGNELIERIKQNFALAESSLSSPPDETTAVSSGMLRYLDMKKEENMSIKQMFGTKTAVAGELAIHLHSLGLLKSREIENKADRDELKQQVAKAIEEFFTN